jgi:hypothetical protein
MYTRMFLFFKILNLLPSTIFYIVKLNACFLKFLIVEI